ncbi:tryptophan halogenase family protein [Sphingomonas japonica]|uniref:Tryptophan halogenase n=1 Tax=Sphingomonas japonica TaxID=511662 RepID=A0ABX0U0A8_9SPHN|nr:tryptophan halogenase family protein [Sphingomonas japonica]NIJ23074.1 tryptophan halogenase [Sphingomonas japonica]
MNADRPKQRVVIAGGGTAGWLVAAALGRLLGQLIDVTLVESDEIGTIGVGESTIPTARTFHRLLGIDERAFMQATNASFKLGIAFEDWGAVGERYFHSFGVLGRSTWMADFHHIWLRARDEGDGSALGDYCFELQAAEAGRFATSDKATINYAYHLDASAYAGFLRGVAEAAGVKRIEGRIADVRQAAESGFITGLALQSGQVIEGDLFIDCTGFRGLLIEGALETGYEDWTHWLSTDSAIAVQTQATTDARPYTRAAAHRAGWQWQIPLRHRVGNGLVFASEFVSDDEAAAMLAERVDGAMLTDPRVIRFRTGRRSKAWNRNCVAFGLSSGFVEPLESTSIHLIMIGIMRLVKLFPFDGINEALVDRYNEQSQRELEGIRDFIILHYHLNRRSDSPFWSRCREMAIPDTLAQRIALFEESAQAYQDAHDLFRVDSWVQVMLGQGLEPKTHHPMARLMSRDQRRQALGDLKRNIASAVATMPSHQAFLDQYGAASPAR